MVLHTVKYKLKNVQYTKKGPKDFGISFNSEEKYTVFYVEPTVHEHKCGASGTLRTPISGTNTGETIEKVKWPPPQVEPLILEDLFHFLMTFNVGR